MSLILHMKIPGAIVVASDCRITGTENLHIPVKQGKKTPEVFDHSKPEKINPQRMDLDEIVHYDFVKTDSEQKSFLLMTDGKNPLQLVIAATLILMGILLHIK